MFSESFSNHFENDTELADDGRAVRLIHDELLGSDILGIGLNRVIRLQYIAEIELRVAFIHK